MYVMGNYPKCYVQINESNTELICDPRVYEVNPRFFKTASKTASKPNNELKLLRLELAVLHAIAKLPFKLQSGALAELEDIDETKDKGRLEPVNDQPDEIEEGIEEKKKKRMLDDFKNQFEDPDDAKYRAEKESMEQSKYSVLSYNVGSIEKGDKFLMELGCS